jgi:type II secretory pathway component PulC
MRTSEYTITPADLANLLRGEGGVDLEPIVEHGKQVAMRIVGVRPNTTAARLGARDGDTIETLNDLPLTSVAEAYRVAAIIAQQAKIVVAGSRDGERYVTVLKLGN